MSIKIEISIPDFSTTGEPTAKATLLSDDMAALGFYREAKRGIYADIVAHIADATVQAPESMTSASEPAAPIDEAPKRRGRKPKDGEHETRPNISTSPENRVDPAQVEADAKQDAEDEAAEAEAKRNPKAPLTIDDVKAAMTAYVTAYGLPATQEDGPRIFVEALGNPPAGESYWKLSLLPDDQEKLQKAVDTWAKAVELNPLKREKIAKGA